MKIVFAGNLAVLLADGVIRRLGEAHEFCTMPGYPRGTADAGAFSAADIIVSDRYDEMHPAATSARLFQVPGAGYDRVRLDLLPNHTRVCNCFGHEIAIAEYVMAAMLRWFVPLERADRQLRRGDWSLAATSRESAREEIAGKALGIIGYGRIGKELARRAAACGMIVHAANRSPIAAPEPVDFTYGLGDLPNLMARLDVVVVCLPLTQETTRLIGAAAFGAMRPTALLINVGRGPVVDEEALFRTLTASRIGGAVIDTWYNYPALGAASASPSAYPYHRLSNVVMTPHMSGWSAGTLARREKVIAGNISALASGTPLVNLVAGKGRPTCLPTGH